MVDISQIKRFNMVRDYLIYISDERQAKINKFLQAEDKICALFTELLMRYVISDELKIKFDEIVFEKTKHGKLFLKGFPDYYFSVSHSGQKIVFVSDNTPIGIDIEQLKTTRDYENITSFFHPSEQSFVMHRLTDANFLKIWTSKEAYVKLIGTGITGDFSQFSVLSRKIGKLIVTINLNNYVLSVASNNVVQIPKNVTYIESSCLLDFVKIL
ncbi:4'-phosphopantetheinyl transferase family protein [Streptococcus ferus]|uniref:4'-phosphopantetheinyl transferase family protein n=1 Tax=Streptococcus ferus TaxID=1345 RepID=UPI00235460AA|nr:4'-phosphopantetheinyl transferase superfamily protein [Streptococcus ferus]